MTNSLNIAIAGCAGRMGRHLIKAGTDAGHAISGGTEASASENLGRDLGALAGLDPIGVKAVEAVEQATQSADVWIDFTIPTATLAALEELGRTRTRVAVIGTTGFNTEQERQIATAAKELIIVKAGNFSLGVNLLEALVKQAAARLGEDWDIEVLETHHRHKVDAPSGTALMLGEAAAIGRGQPLETLRAKPYEGPSAKRNAGEIGFSVRRSGGVIGDHDVTFTSEMETISLRHTALDRAVFAYGAIKAAEWASTQAPGLYDMSDVLGV